MSPLLWKKAKTGKIARLVCDLRRKRSRSPLVVQTGFPTSLADIIVKNSARLKKPPPTKNAGSDPPSSSSTASIDSQGQILDSVPCDDGRRLVDAREQSTAPPVLAGDAEEVGSAGNVGVTGPACFTAIAKVFIVVVLALGTKELAVAITASVIVLCFLEFIGKRWLFPPKPTDAAPLALDSGVRYGRDGEEARMELVSDSINRQRSLELPGTELERKHYCVHSSDRAVSLKNVAHREGRANTEIHREGSTEIQAIECDLGFQRTRSSELDPLESKWKREASTSKDDPHLAGIKRKKPHKVGSKKFMEKFLKKLRPKKKHGKCHKMASADIPICKGEEECEEEEEPDDEDEICSSESSCNEVTDEEEEEGEYVDEESVCRMIPWNTGHLVFLAVILLGLIGGRGVALTLTMSSFVVLKAVKTIWARLKMSPANDQPCG